MAIQRKNQERTGPALPEEFQARVTKALTFQQIGAKYEDAFKTEKAWILSYLESENAQVSIEQGKALNVENGSVLFASRENPKVDSDGIKALIDDGTLTIDTLLRIAKVDAKKLKEIIPAKVYAVIVTVESTEYLTLKATPEFKGEVDRLFDVNALAAPVQAGVVAAVENRAVAKKDLEAVTEAKPAASSLARAKAAAAKSMKADKPAKGDVDSDLDAILNGKG